MNYRTSLAMIVCVTASLGCLLVYSEAGEAGVKPVNHFVTEVSDSQLALEFGGYCDNYCEAYSSTCNSSPGYLCVSPLTVGSYCARCKTDTVVEVCNGDYFCIPGWSCTDCIIDLPVNCGKKTFGSCTPTSCNAYNTMTTDCGEAFKCHTS